MMTKDIVKGLQILDSYTIDRYSVYAEHDTIHFSPTTRVINTEDLKILASLGWLQDKFHADDINGYSPSEGWYCYV